MLIAGNIIAFIVAMIAIKSFIHYVQKHSFRAFGVYRIIAGIAILGLIWGGIIKNEKEKDAPKPAVAVITNTVR